MRSLQPIFVWQERFDAASVLKNKIFFKILIFEVEIVASGKTDYNCKIKETLFIKELNPAVNANLNRLVISRLLYK